MKRRQKASPGEYLTVSTRGALRPYYPLEDSVKFLVMRTEWSEDRQTWFYTVANGNNMFEFTDELIEGGYSSNKSARVLLEKEY